MEKQNVKKNDFIELEFTAMIKDSGIIFDTNVKADAEKAKLPIKNLKPLGICIGQGMVVKGFDKELENKEVGKNYNIDINPNDAFGNRDLKLIKTVPMKIFAEKKINPYRGLMLNMDGMIARIVSVSGGRVMVDFNNPLSGKVINYNFKIARKIEKINDKIKSLSEFFCGEEPDVKVDGKKAEIKLKEKRNADVLKKKVKEILGIEIDVKEKEEKKEEEKKEKEQEKEEKKEKEQEKEEKKEKEQEKEKKEEENEQNKKSS